MTITLSNLLEKDFNIAHLDHSPDYRTESFAFNFYGCEYWASAHVPSADLECDIFVLYERNDYYFATMEDAICFSLGGTFVQDIVDSNNSFAMRECTKADDYSSEELTNMAIEFIDTLKKDDLITELQAQKLKIGAEEYACVWF